MFIEPVGGPPPNSINGPFQSCQADNAGIQLVVVAVDDTGAPLNLRGVNSPQIVLQAPDGTVLTFTATLLTNGLDGALQYTTGVDDLVELGLYCIQAQFTLNGNAQSTRWGRFNVEGNIA